MQDEVCAGAVSAAGGRPGDSSRPGLWRGLQRCSGGAFREFFKAMTTLEAMTTVKAF